VKLMFDSLDRVNERDRETSARAGSIEGAKTRPRERSRLFLLRTCLLHSSIDRSESLITCTRLMSTPDILTDQHCRHMTGS
jgi:hypothetical protein